MFLSQYTLIKVLFGAKAHLIQNPASHSNQPDMSRMFTGNSFSSEFISQQMLFSDILHQNDFQVVHFQWSFPCFLVCTATPCATLSLSNLKACRLWHAADYGMQQKDEIRGPLCTTGTAISLGQGTLKQNAKVPKGH